LIDDWGCSILMTDDDEDDDWWLIGLTDRFVIWFLMFERIIVILMIVWRMQWWMIDDRWMIVGLIDFEKMIDDRLGNSQEQWETGNTFERGMFRWFGNIGTHSRQKETKIP